MNIRMTVEGLLKYGICEEWPEIRKHISDNSTLLEMLNDRQANDEGRVWCATRFLPDAINRRFAADCALRVAHLWNMPPVVREYLETLDEKLSGKADYIARAAAADYRADNDGDQYTKYYDADYDMAAECATYAAECATATAFAFRDCAADHAANAANWAADAADVAEVGGNAEGEWQINRLIELIKWGQ